LHDVLYSIQIRLRSKVSTVSRGLISTVTKRMIRFGAVYNVSAEAACKRLKGCYTLSLRSLEALFSCSLSKDGNAPFSRSNCTGAKHNGVRFPVARGGRRCLVCVKAKAFTVQRQPTGHLGRGL